MAEVDTRQAAMLDFAAKLTHEPGNMLKEDTAKLRVEGFSDTDILHIVEVVSYFAYVNRIANGLGVELEDDNPS